MRISIEEIATLIAASSSRAAYDTKDIAALQERVLKLEYKYKELIDILTDLRAHQIMGEQDHMIMEGGIRVNIIKEDNDE